MAEMTLFRHSSMTSAARIAAFRFPVWPTMSGFAKFSTIRWYWRDRRRRTAPAAAPRPGNRGGGGGGATAPGGGGRPRAPPGGDVPGPRVQKYVTRDSGQVLVRRRRLA